MNRTLAAGALVLAICTTRATGDESVSLRAVARCPFSPATSTNAVYDAALGRVELFVTCAGVIYEVTPNG